MSKKPTEMIYDQDGKLFLTQPYLFRSLFALGQEMVINRVSMTVLSCEYDRVTNIVTTKVKLHKP